MCKYRKREVRKSSKGRQGKMERTICERVTLGEDGVMESERWKRRPGRQYCAGSPRCFPT